MSAPRDLERRLVERIEREAKRMAAECSNPPCLHAQGLDLATEYVRDEFAEVRHEEKQFRAAKRARLAAAGPT